MEDLALLQPELSRQNSEAPVPKVCCEAVTLGKKAN